MQWNEALDWSPFQVLWIIFKSLEDPGRWPDNNWHTFGENAVLNSDSKHKHRIISLPAGHRAQASSSERQPLPRPWAGIAGTGSEWGRRWGWSPARRGIGGGGGWLQPCTPWASFFAVSLRLKRECGQRNLIVIDRRKRYSQVSLCFG